MGRDWSKVSPDEQVWRQSGGLGLGGDAIRIHLHEIGDQIDTFVF